MPNFYSTLRRFALTALLSGGGLLAAQAQTLSQPLTGATNVAGTYTDLGTTGTAIATANTDNANSAAQAIGFPFGFNGTVFTQFVLNTNGVLRLGAAAPSSTNLFIDGSASAIDPVQSTSSADVNLLLPFNIDLMSGTGGAEYRVATTGTAGSRVCTIQWKNVADKTGTGTNNAGQYSNFSFQVKLYEGPGTIEFVYDAATASAAAANSRDANVGLKGSGVSTGQLLLAGKTSTTAWSAATFQNTAYGLTGTFNIDKTALPTAGRTFRFTDPAYCVAGTVTGYPYTQNFDGATAPALPCGVTVVDGNSDGNTWATYNSTTYANSAPNSMRYVGNASAANDWFFTTSLTMTAGMSYQVQYKYRSYSATYTQGLEVKVGTTATAAGQTTALYNGTFSNATYNTSNNTQVALFTPTTSGTYYFGFHAISAASQMWLLVDDVQVTEVPTPACPQPTSIVVSNVAATTATVAFAPPAGGTTYSVIYGPKGFTPPTGGTATPLAAATSVALTGLNSNTAYDVYVQATCGTAGTSVYTGPFTFTTACAAVTAYPYLETFDTVTAPALPCGVTVIDVNADGATWKNVSNATYAASGTNAITYNYSTGNVANDWFFTNALQMRMGYSYQLQFKYRGYGSLVEAMEVKVGNAATVAAQTTTVFTNSNFNSATYTTTVAGNTAGQVVLFTPTTAGTYYFGFHATSPANQWYIYVDDVQVTEVVSPACPQPTALAVSSVTATGAAVAFSGPTNGTSYSVIYGPKGFTPPTGGTASAASATSPITITGLNSNTAYDVYVQATCGTSGTSTYTGPVSFTTACATNTVFPYLETFDSVTAPALPCGITVLDANADGTTWTTYNSTTYASSTPNSMRYAGNTNVANDWFFTNGLAMTLGKSYQLQFKYRSYTTAYNQGLEVKAGNAATAAGQTTPVFTSTFNNATYNTTTNGQAVLFTPTATGTYYFGFHAISAASQLWLLVDDVQVTEINTPACLNPGNPVVSGITTTGATVTFTGPTNASGYSVIYGPKGFVPSSTSSSTPVAAGNTVTLTGLTSNTQYDVYVQSTCGTAGTSTYTGPVSFTTACATVTTFPYLETFDTVTAPALPCGMTVIDVNADGATWKNVSNVTYAASGTNAITYNYSTGNAANDWFFTNALSLQAGATYQLQFKYRGYGSLTEAMEVKVGSLATPAGQTTTVFTNSSFNSSTYTTTTAGTGAGQVASFTPITSGIYYFGFHAISPANQWYIYVDDVRVDAVSLAACPTPTNVQLSGVTASSATVSFTGPTALATGGYTVIYGPPGFDPTTSGTRVTGTASPITINNLTSLTNYDVYVVAACASSVTSFSSAKVSFTSACATTLTFPYTETFDGVTAPALPCGVTVLDANADGSTWVNSNYTPSSGTNSMRYSPSTVNAADDWFFTNALSLKASMKYQLQFKYRVFTYNYPEKMEVKIGTSTTAASQATTLFSNLAMINTAYTTTSPGAQTGQVATFTPSADGTYFIGFHAMSIANQFDIYVDDVQVTAAPVLATKSSVAAGFSAEASPVPFSDRLTVTLNTLAAGPLQLTLHDAVGRVVRETTATVPAGASSLAVPGAGSLPAGMYILTVRQGGNTQVIRVAHE